MSNRRQEGFEKLWGSFALSRATWLAIPRAMMHEMPDEWQGKMADLIEEWDNHWDWGEEYYGTRVNVTKNGKMVSAPDWLINYRHPDLNKLESMVATSQPDTPPPESDTSDHHDDGKPNT